MAELKDPTLNSITRILRSRYRCHTVILYGSRARGQASSASDYDVIGVCRGGSKTQIAKMRNGQYWDVFVYSERDLKKLGEQHLIWKDAQILYERGPYGQKLLSRIQKLVETSFKPHPKYEIAAIKVWAQKAPDRSRTKTIQAPYRRAELQAALIEHYFFVRQKRFWGPNEGFYWIRVHDPESFKFIRRALKYPQNISYLKAAASRVYKVKLK